MKKLTTIAAIAFAMAFTVPAFAQQVNNPTQGASFAGNVSRSDHAFAFVTVSGPFVPTMTNPLNIHFVDGTNDFECNITSVADIAITHNSGNQNGTATLYPVNCYNNHTGAAVTASGHGMEFYWSWANQTGTAWNIVAEAIDVMFPCSPVCLYDSFSGVGIVYNP